MPNRAQKRKMNKKKMEPEKVIKKEKSFLERKFNMNSDLASFFTTIFVVFVSFLIVLALTLLLGNAGFFDAGYTPLETEETKISYENISIGTVFTRNDSEYYVVFADFSGDDENAYLTNQLYSYKGVLYKVDMSNKMNSVYESEQGNYSASKSTELSINGPTLIKIVNGVNAKYIEGVENIVNELI